MGGLENFSKIDKEGGDNYLVLESACFIQTIQASFIRHQQIRKIMSGKLHQEINKASC